MAEHTYAVLEYVFNNYIYNTNYINLLYVTTPRFKISMDILISSYQGGQSKLLLGNNEIKLYTYYNSTTTGIIRELRFQFGGSTDYVAIPFEPNVKFNLQISNNYIEVDGYRVSAEVNPVKIFSEPIYVLGSKYENGSSYYSPFRLYKMEIFDKGQSVMSLLPVRKLETNEYGLYDKAGDLFYKNEGTSSQGAGEIIDYIDVSDENKTTNLKLGINIVKKDKMQSLLTIFNSNMKKIDRLHPIIVTKDTLLNSGVSNINQSLIVDHEQKQRIYSQLETKVAAEQYKSLVANILINKLSQDYSNLDLDELFATNLEFQQIISDICDTIMLDYYTKAKIDEIIEQGDPVQMSDYYTKIQINELIPEKEDLTVVQKFLDAQVTLKENLAIFTMLNGLSN